MSQYNPILAACNAVQSYLNEQPLAVHVFTYPSYTQEEGESELLDKETFASDTATD